MIKLAIVSPCYNEESIIADSSKQLITCLDSLKNASKVTTDSFILFVNDGSSDSTWDVIESEHLKNKSVCGISLSSNVGHQKALLAGILSANKESDAVITIDSDLQDDLSSIEKMIDAMLNGAEVVYGVKRNREADSIIKKYTARQFYRIQKKCGINIIEDHADFRLLSHAAICELEKYTERNIYLRGIIPLMGMKYTIVDEDIKPSKGRKSRYNAKRMIELAVDGITSFSTKPINCIIYCGLAMLIISFFIFIYVICSLVLNHYAPGWASIMLSIWFLGSIVTIAIGIIGVYIGKIYIEVKQRPHYRIVKTLGITDEREVI